MKADELIKKKASPTPKETPVLRKAKKLTASKSSVILKKPFVESVESELKNFKIEASKQFVAIQATLTEIAKAHLSHSKIFESPISTAIKDKPNQIKIVSKNAKLHSNTKQVKLKDDRGRSRSNSSTRSGSGSSSEPVHRHHSKKSLPNNNCRTSNESLQVDYF